MTPAALLLLALDRVLLLAALPACAVCGRLRRVVLG